MNFQWLNIASEMISKSHAATQMWSDIDLFLLLFTIACFALEFLTTLAFTVWVCRLRQGASRTVKERCTADQ